MSRKLFSDPNFPISEKTAKEIKTEKQQPWKISWASWKRN
jgi:hypothetical protein